MLITYTALVLLAITPIWFGSLRSLNKPLEVESLQTKDAYMFPVIGSCVLFGLYLLFKFLSKYWINLLMSFYFTAIAISALTATFHPILKMIFPSSITKMKPISMNLKVPLFMSQAHKLNIQIIDIFGGIISVCIGIWYFTTKNWIANNLIGEAFSFVGIELIALGGYKTGAVLLSGLFFYDIFWVFGTDVMVTVAKSFDAPIKVLFPRNLLTAGDAPYQFSMLGLGDIVIPGIFVALMFRFDHYLSKKNKNHGRVYFYTCFISYFLGLVTTIVVMHFFQAAQPALLYLVPFCLGSVTLVSIIRGEFSILWNYTDDVSNEKKQEKKTE